MSTLCGQFVPLSDLNAVIPYPEKAHRWNEHELKRWCESRIVLGKTIRTATDFQKELKWHGSPIGKLTYGALLKDLSTFMDVAYEGRPSDFRLVEADRDDFTRIGSALIKKWQEAFNIPSPPREHGSPLFVQLLWNRIIALKAAGRRRKSHKPSTNRRRIAKRPVEPTEQLDTAMVFEESRIRSPSYCSRSPSSMTYTSCEDENTTYEQRRMPEDVGSVKAVDTHGSDLINLDATARLTDLLASSEGFKSALSTVIEDAVDRLWRTTHTEEGLDRGRVVATELAEIFEPLLYGERLVLRKLADEILTVTRKLRNQDCRVSQVQGSQRVTVS